MTISVAQATTFLLVLLRMTGFLVFNPIFGRTNVPTMVRSGLAFVMAILLVGGVPAPQNLNPTLGPFLGMVAVELLVGFAAGMIFQMFLSILIVGGEVVDMQLGISMAKAFDPGTNASVSVSSSFFNVMFILTFFLTNNHLTFIRMCAQSFQIIPPGTVNLRPIALAYIPDLFSSILVFSMKLCLPIVVIELITTMAVGIIMRIIPQINVFVVNIQFKLLVGIFVLVLLVPSLANYFENLILICFERIGEAWTNFT